MQKQNEPANHLLAQALERVALPASTGHVPALSGLRGGGKAWLAAALAWRRDGQGSAGPLVLVADSFDRAERLWQDVRWFGGEGAWFFPHWDTMPFDNFSPQKELMAQRFAALDALLEGRCRLLVTTVQALMQGMIPPAVFGALRLKLAQGEKYSRAGLAQALQNAGYNRVDVVEAPGEYALRGAIVDLFPVQLEQPVRLDFFDDELETLRFFEVESQQTTSPLERLTLYPASEGVVNAETAKRGLAELPRHKAGSQPETYRQVYGFLERGVSFPGVEQLMGLLYPQVGWLHQALPPGSLLLLDEPEALEERAGAFHQEVLQEYEVCLEQGNLSLPPDSLYQTPAQWRAALAGLPRVALRGLRLEEQGAGLFPLADNAALRASALGQQQLAAGEAQAGAGEAGHQAAHTVLTALAATLKGWLQQGAAVMVAARSRTGAQRLQELLEPLGLAGQLAEPSGAGVEGQEVGALGVGLALLETAQPGQLLILERGPNEGLRVVDGQGATRLALLTEEELLGVKARPRRVKKSTLQAFFSSLGDLKEGDPVVHVEYGIGRYQGLKRIKTGPHESDFLVLAFAGGDKVYVPVYNFNQVQRYSGLESAAPALSKLGDGSWGRTKARASRQVEEMAGDLVRLYAERAALKGFAAQPGGGAMTEFEEAFAYQETEDQARSIEEVLADMGSEKPMDRLVCGDVGFGKTEVAMRAAYMAALSGKQVLVLVPTTILAQQHYQTFSKRFANFPVTVDVLSRFSSPARQKETLKALAEGQLDILIGTHRLLGKDVQPKDLGLLVVDEEQRFGVGHKEKIKQLKRLVDVLTLSATPIPRTLHMSLMGVRDLSIINTPPMDRLAVRTRIFKSSDYIIGEAVGRELRRGGQVFFVHNRVETIHAYGAYLQSVLPRVRIAVAHGQMGEHQLEEVMLAFMQGEVEVLLSTTIIESGLDIPRANTIIINNADTFGLAQLYQMRGRVGRSNVQAYAYLLVSPEKVLTEVAQKRLTLLQELNDLGSGFKIASHDLEIRGAGNLLGSEQSGHINAVGLELYTMMVEEAVGKLKGEEQAASSAEEFKMELGFPYLIPEEYIASTRQRLEVYKEMAGLKNEEEVWGFRQRLEDRFGAPPAELDSLLGLIRVRLLAQYCGIVQLERTEGNLFARFAGTHPLDVAGLMKLAADPASGVRLHPDGRVVLGPMPPKPEGVLERLKRLAALVPEKAA